MNEELLRSKRVYREESCYYYNQHGYTRFASVDLTANLPRYTILSRVSFPLLGNTINEE